MQNSLIFSKWILTQNQYLLLNVHILPPVVIVQQTYVQSYKYSTGIIHLHRYCQNLTHDQHPQKKIGCFYFMTMP